MKNLIGEAMIYYFLYTGIIFNIFLVIRGLISFIKSILKGGK